MECIRKAWGGDVGIESSSRWKLDRWTGLSDDAERP